MRGVLIASAVAGAIACATTAAAQSVGLGTSPPGGFAHTQGSIIAAEIFEAVGVQMRIQPFSSLEFGLASMFEAYLATQGLMHFKGKPLTNLRVLSPLSTLRLGFFVRKDSPIKSLADLKGKRVTSGFTQQPIIQPLAAAHLEAVGLTEEDYTPVPVSTVIRGADDFAARRIDAFFFALGSGKLTEVDAAVGGIRVLPLEDTRAARAAVKRHVQPGYIRLEEPSPGMAGVPQPTPVIAYDSAILAGADVAEDVVYKITKVLYERADKLRAATPALSLHYREIMAKMTDPVQYHPGAIKHYSEAGVWPPKQ